MGKNRENMPSAAITPRSPNRRRRPTGCEEGKQQRNQRNPTAETHTALIKFWLILRLTGYSDAMVNREALR